MNKDSLLEILREKLDNIATQVHMSQLVEANNLIRGVTINLGSKLWEPHRAEAFQVIREVLDAPNDNMLRERRNIFEGLLRQLLDLEFQQFDSHLNDVFNVEKSKVYPPGTDTDTEVERIIESIKEHPSFKSLNEDAKKNISDALENKKQKMGTILEKQKSGHADGKLISYLWNMLFQAIRSILLPSTTAKHAKGELETLKKEVKKQSRGRP